LPLENNSENQVAAARRPCPNTITTTSHVIVKGVVDVQNLVGAGLR
jgi:hypothetical protein